MREISDFNVCYIFIKADVKIIGDAYEYCTPCMKDLMKGNMEKSL